MVSWLSLIEMYTRQTNLQSFLLTELHGAYIYVYVKPHGEPEGRINVAANQ